MFFLIIFVHCSGLASCISNFRPIQFLVGYYTYLPTIHRNQNKTELCDSKFTISNLRVREVDWEFGVALAIAVRDRLKSESVALMQRLPLLRLMQEKILFLYTHVVWLAD